jgi:hypothetical protein
MKTTWRKKALLGFSAFLFLMMLSFIIFKEVDNHSANECAYDGAKIDPLYEVQFGMKDGEVIRFCSVVCAIHAFSQGKERIGSVLVTDEVTAMRLNAKDAFFIESSVVTVPHVKNRIHAFASEFDAVRHRDQYSGKHIESPFVLFSPWREEVIGNRKVRIKIDPLSGLPRIIKGKPNILKLENLDLRNLTEEAARKAMTALLSLLEDYLAVGIDELQFGGMKHVGDSWYISFWQTYEGVIIYESSIGFSIGPEGEISSVGSLLHNAHKSLNLPSRPRLALKEAKEIAVNHLMDKEPYDYEFVAYQLIVYPMRRKEEVVGYYLAYILNFYYPEEIRVTRSRAGWVCFVDAVTGEIIDVQNLLAIASCCMPAEDEEKISDRNNIDPPIVALSCLRR